MRILLKVWNLELQSTIEISFSMKNHPKQFIAIDINIFLRLFGMSKLDSEVKHIGKLLDRLQELGVYLIVDDQWKIWRNYMSKIGRIMKYSKEFNFAEIFHHWFGPDADFKIIQVKEDELFANIVETLKNENYLVDEEQEIDTLLVYITVCEDTMLISNDRSDFIGQTGNIRKELKCIAKTYGCQMFMIFDSNEAYEWLLHP